MTIQEKLLKKLVKEKSKFARLIEKSENQIIEIDKMIIELETQIGEGVEEKKGRKKSK